MTDRQAAESALCTAACSKSGTRTNWGC